MPLKSGRVRACQDEIISAFSLAELFFQRKLSFKLIQYSSNHFHYLVMMFVEVNRRVRQNIAFPDRYPGLNKDSDKASTGNSSFLSFSIEYKHYWMKMKEG